MEAFSPTPVLLAMGHFAEGTPGQTYWYHLEGRGSVAGLTKHLGQSTHNYRYDAYGQVLPALGNFTDPHNHYSFLGKEWDEKLGLYEFGVRFYDPWVGVWLTREPLPADAWRPRTWHRYTYAFANPVSYYDVYGLQTLSITPVPVPTSPPVTPTPTGTPGPRPTPMLTPAPQPLPTPPGTPIPGTLPKGANPCLGLFARSPDYIVLNISWSPTGGIWGIGGFVIRDRFGRIYLAAAVSLGESLSYIPPSTVIPISGNISAGWLRQVQKPETEELKTFLTRWGGNVNVGFVIGAGYSTNLQKDAVEVGFYSPQIGGSVYYSVLIRDATARESEYKRYENEWEWPELPYPLP